MSDLMGRKPIAKEDNERLFLIRKKLGSENESVTETDLHFLSGFLGASVYDTKSADLFASVTRLLNTKQEKAK